MQGGNPSCVAWAIGNASQALGTPLPDDLLRILHCEAYSGLKTGVTLQKAIEIMQRYCDETPGDIHIKKMSGNLHLYPVDKKTDDEHTTAEKYPHALDRYFHKWARNVQSKLLSTKIAYNGRLIHCILSEGDVPVVNVFSEALSGRNREGSKHAISLVGYQISEESYMNVQFVDSRFGRSFLAPLEHLSKAIVYPRNDENIIVVGRNQ